ncbi:heterokaryon incompatibility protein-domain-containing protein, partial [Diaporthe sp. PMI_573]
MNKPLGQSSFLPSRLLDLGPITTRHLPQGPTQKLHLIDTRQTAIGDSNYVALSHRWASQNDPRLDLTTKSCTLQARMDGIETEKLSKTYRFAVDICHWLGVRYLWIDSFCIIQDSKSDWDAESKLMAQIYRCAFCTISINIPETPDNPLWTNCGYGGEEAEGWVVDTINTGSWKTVSDSPWMALLESGPLGSRAWCLQERQLSPRVIHFLDPGMIMWECCSFIAALGGPIIFGNLTRESKPDNQKRIIDMKSRSGSGHKHMWRAWSMCLSDYTSRSLTIETDRPVAIRGVVDQIKIVTKSEYIYGLWREDLNRGLLWERHASTGNCWTRAPVVNGEQAPTWSWLSITGPVK